MKAIVCNEFGPLSDLKFQDIEDPTPGKGEVLIKVLATGVNFPDGLLVQGLYQARPDRPFLGSTASCASKSGLAMSD